MAFLIPNLSPSIHFLQHQSSSSTKPKYLNPHAYSSSSLKPTAISVRSSTSLETLPTQRGAQVNDPLDTHDKQKNEFYINLGLAVRTLREDLPLLFSKDLTYDIYRDDITFADPLNTFTGIENYKLIFWALWVHGKLLFRDITLEVFRVWQPSENVILIRWNLRGIPRVPWEAKGEFQGTSRYKLDRKGKIYEHKVDNLAFNFPQRLKPAATVMDLVGACPASPNPTFLWGPTETYPCSWVEFYRAVTQTLDQERYVLSQDALVTCS